MQIRLSKLTKRFSIGLSTLVDFLNANGFSADLDPNAMVTDECLPLLRSKFGDEINSELTAAKIKDIISGLRSGDDAHITDKRVSDVQSSISTSLPEGYKEGYSIDENHLALKPYGSEDYVLCDTNYNPIFECNKHKITFLTVEPGPTSWSIVLVGRYDKRTLFHLKSNQLLKLRLEDGLRYSQDAYSTVCDSCILVSAQGRYWDDEYKEIDFTANALLFETGKEINGIKSCFVCTKEEIIIFGGELPFGCSYYDCAYGCVSFQGDVILPSIFENIVLSDGQLIAERGGMSNIFTLEGELVLPNGVLPRGYISSQLISEDLYLVEHRNEGWGHEHLVGLYDSSRDKWVVPVKYEEIQPLENGLFIVCENWFSYGLIGNDYRVLLPAEYSSLSYVSDDTFIFSVLSDNGEELYGLIDIEGSVLMKACYSSLKYISKGVFICSRSDGSGTPWYSVINDKGDSLLPTKYSSIRIRENGTIEFVLAGIPRHQDITFTTDLELNTLYQVQEKTNTLCGIWMLKGSFSGNWCIFIDSLGKEGIVDVNSQIVTSRHYDEILQLGTRSIFVGIYDEKKFLINPQTRGERHLQQYDTIFVDDSDYSDGLVHVSLNGERGLIDCSGNVVLDCKYSDVRVEKDYIALSAGNYIGRARKDGTIIFPCRYHNYDVLDNGCFVVKGEYCTLLSPTGQLLLDDKVQYEEIERTTAQCLVAKIRREGGDCVCGLISKSGQLIVPPKYLVIKQFISGCARVNEGGAYETKRVYGSEVETIKGGKWGVLDEHGRYVVERKYDMIRDESEGAWVVARRRLDGRVGFGLETRNGLTVPCAYSYIRDSKDGMLVFAVGGQRRYKGWAKEFLAMDNGIPHYLLGAKWGVMSALGETIIEPFADFIRIISENKVAYRINDKYGIINLQTLEQTLLSYDYLSSYHEGMCIAGRLYGSKMRYGFINERYEEVVACIYEQAFTCKDGECVVSSGNNDYVFDKEGNLVEDDSTQYNEDSYDWERETWYAMTDGQEGDYPGPGVDYD